MQIRIEKYLDIGCDICGMHRSTDFNKGMYIVKNITKAQEILRHIAIQEGWGQKNNLTCCPICMKNKEENT